MLPVGLVAGPCVSASLFSLLLSPLFSFLAATAGPSSSSPARSPAVQTSPTPALAQSPARSTPNKLRKKAVSKGAVKPLRTDAERDVSGRTDKTDLELKQIRLKLRASERDLHDLKDHFARIAEIEQKLQATDDSQSVLSAVETTTGTESGSARRPVSDAPLTRARSVSDLDTLYESENELSELISPRGDRACAAENAATLSSTSTSSSTSSTVVATWPARKAGLVLQILSDSEKEEEKLTSPVRVATFRDKATESAGRSTLEDLLSPSSAAAAAAAAAAALSSEMEEDPAPPGLAPLREEGDSGTESDSETRPTETVTKQRSPSPKRIVRETVVDVAASASEAVSRLGKQTRGEARPPRRPVAPLSPRVPLSQAVAGIDSASRRPIPTPSAPPRNNGRRN